MKIRQKRIPKIALFTATKVGESLLILKVSTCESGVKKIGFFKFYFLVTFSVVSNRPCVSPGTDDEWITGDIV